MKLNLVLFDVDGVLLNSLPAHLKISEDLASRYDLGPFIPDEEEMKRRVRKPTKISPMHCFFESVGYPHDKAIEAEKEYRATFAKKYDLPLFAGVGEMLKQLKAMSIRLGIVTSNLRENIAPPLQTAWHLFEQDAIICFDRGADFSKAAAIGCITQRIGVESRETLYIGDQWSDYEAAKAAQVHFLGAQYGWGIREDERHFPIVQKPADIVRFVHEQAGT